MVGRNESAGKMVRVLKHNHYVEWVIMAGSSQTLSAAKKHTKVHCYFSILHCHADYGDPSHEPVTSGTNENVGAVSWSVMVCQLSLSSQPWVANCCPMLHLCPYGITAWGV